MEWLPLNLSIMRHPTNWITVWLMLLIGGLFLHFSLQYIHSNKED